jgi:hypothetical protein
MENKYAIIENDIVVNVAVATEEFAASQGWILMPTYVDGKAVGIDWLYINDQFVSPPPSPTPEEIQEQNKQQAEYLLQQTDWTSIPAVADPLRSNPYLTNQGEFDAYRSQLREIAVNPPTTPAVFPTQPQEIWSN